MYGRAVPLDSFPFCVFPTTNFTEVFSTNNACFVANLCLKVLGLPSGRKTHKVHAQIDTASVADSPKVDSGYFCARIFTIIYIG
jgi:hypothetical protein